MILLIDANYNNNTDPLNSSNKLYNKGFLVFIDVCTIGWMLFCIYLIRNILWYLSFRICVAQNGFFKMEKNQDGFLLYSSEQIQLDSLIKVCPKEYNYPQLQNQIASLENKMERTPC